VTPIKTSTPIDPKIICSIFKFFALKLQLSEPENRTDPAGFYTPIFYHFCGSGHSVKSE
jgi:hypothetical protein